MAGLLRPRSVAFALLATATAAAVSCYAPLVPADVKLNPDAIAIVSTTNPTQEVGTALSGVPRVRVRDQFGDPLPDVRVTFIASSGTQPSPNSATTDNNGEAAPGAWTLPTTPGTVTITAAAQGGPSTQLSIAVNPGPPSALTVPSGTPANQQGIAGTPVGTAPQVRIADRFGNPVSGVNVTWAIVSGGGTLNGTTAATVVVATNAQGISALTAWHLGATAGANSVRATATGTGITGNPATFTATGVAGPAAQIVIAPGTPTSQGQTAQSGQSVAVAPAVLVRDVNDNVVAGVTVRFVVASGGGRVLSSASDATGSTSLDAQTNASGIATIFGWRLGTAGSNTLSVTVPSVTSVPAFIINATATAGAPAAITKVNSPWEFTRPLVAINGTVRVRVTDAASNNVSGATVVWSAGANGSVSGTLTSVTDANGLATFSGTWTAGSTIGTDAILNATVQGTSITPVAFSSTIVGSPASITISAGNGQTATAGSAVSVRPAVIVRDGANRPVPGLTVTFAVTAGGGSVSGATPSTDSAGIATVGGWTLGGSSPSQSLQATVNLTSLSVTFSATATGTCGGTQAYTLGSTVNGAFAVNPCEHNFSFTTSTASTFFRMLSTGTGFTAMSVAALWGPGGAIGTTGQVYMIVPAGSWTVTVTQSSSTGTGTYSMQTTVNAAHTSCSSTFIAYAVTASQSLTSGCTHVFNASSSIGGRTAAVRHYYIYQPAGKTLTVRMASAEFDTYLEAYVLGGSFLTFSDDFSGTNSQITLSAPSVSRYIHIHASHYVVSGGTPRTDGNFTITIDP